MIKKRTALAAVLLGTVLMACGPVVAPSLRTGTASLFSTGKATIEPPVCTEMPSPNFNERNGTPIDTIVLHHTAMASDAAHTGQYFQDPASKVSSHYIVDRSGSIVRCVPDDKRAWHAGKSAFNGRPDVNTFSIGIEICNVGDNVEPYPQAQVDAVVHLTAWLAKTYNVPVANLTRHRDVALPAGRKNDTSDNFDQQYVYKAVADLIAGRKPAAYHAASPPPGYDPTKQSYTVHQGDTWESIAEDLYDTPTMAKALRAANPNRSLAPGAVIKRPTNYK